MRNSLHNQLTWSFIGLATIPLLLVAVLVSARSFVTQNEQAQTLQAQVAQRVGISVQAYLGELENELVNFAAWSGIHTADLEKKQALLQDLLAHQDAFDEVVLLDDRGTELLVVSRSRVLTEDQLGSRPLADEFTVPRASQTTYFSSLRLDEATSKPLMTLSIPLLNEQGDQVTGVLVAEARMKRVWDLLASFELTPGENVYLLDSENTVIAHPNPTVALRRLSYSPPASSGISRGLNGDSAVVVTETFEAGGQVFSVVAEKKLTEAFGLAIGLAAMVGLLIVAAGGLASYLGVASVRRVVGPIEALSITAQSIAAGNLTRQVDVSGSSEIGQLAQSFRQMQKSLRESRSVLEEYASKLEQNVNIRTKELEQRTIQLQTTAELGSAVASLRGLDELLSTAAGLISQRFGFYHVGIFLLDSEGEYAVLRASNSPGGQRMLQRGHQLKVGQQGIVGHVTATRSPRIALDVGADATFFNNPDLPNTRSEMALPLLVGGKLLGVLDVQSEKQSAFTHEDTEILQILANQVGVAIENSLLYTESQASLERISRAYGELSGRAWQNLLRAMPDLGYTCTEDMITPASKEWTPELREACEAGKVVLADGQTLAIPIKIRDRVNGAIRLRKIEETGVWNSEEISLIQNLTDQLGVALESARLYQETQRRAEREKMAGEITAHLRASNDPQAILQTAVRELRQALQVNKAQVTLQARPVPGAPEPNLEETQISGNGHTNGGNGHKNSRKSTRRGKPPYEGASPAAD